MVLELRLGDVLRLKKAHPCGGDLWEVVRLGADIGVRCRKCDRYVLHLRSYLQRRVREVVRTPAKPGAPSEAPGE